MYSPGSGVLDVTKIGGPVPALVSATTEKLYSVKGLRFLTSYSSVSGPVLYDWSEEEEVTWIL